MLTIYPLQTGLLYLNYIYSKNFRDIEPVRRSKWDVGHGNGYNSARGQPQNNYPVMTSGQYRKY